MTYFEYDGSFEGMLTAVFDCYEQKVTDIRIRKAGSTDQLLFTEIVTIVTDEAKVERVWKKLAAIFGVKGVRVLWKAWLSELEHVDNLILETIRYGLKLQQNVLNDFGNIHVIELQQAVKSVDREKHRMEAFVRFQLTKDELYYAVVEPDFNVLPLIVSHFGGRYADQRWLIFDSRRRFGIYYDLVSASFVDFMPNEMLSHAQPVANALDEKETLYTDLWNDYFRSTNIASRKNLKLHTQHVPKRYWKYLTEKNRNAGTR